MTTDLPGDCVTADSIEIELEATIAQFKATYTH